MNNRAVEATLYYVRLKTHRSSQLFGSSENVSENECIETAQLPSATLSKAAFSKIVADELLFAADQRGIALDQWVVVPDAVHALAFVREYRPTPDLGTGKPRQLTSFVAAFKAATAKRINLMRNQPGSSVWQRSYNEQRVEDEFMLNRLRRKITDATDVIVSSQRLSP
ncbi:MAG: hypothetical protein AAFP03_05450 [Cyanobacteria bacterium J06598_3]